MKRPGGYLSKRALLTLSVGFGLLPHLSMADIDKSWFWPMFTPAIKVKNPAGGYLIAIARTGSRLIAAGEHGVIIYSDDNGVTWPQASVPVDVTITCLAFASPKLGWAAGHFGIVLATTDGGMTWQEQLNGTQVDQMSLKTAQAVLGENNNPSPAAALSQRRANHFMETGPSQPFLSILVLSPEQVFVFGAYRMAVRTGDGGKTWADESLEIYDKFSNHIYDAICVNSSIYAVGEAGMIFCSTDGGRTFPALVSPSSTTFFGILGAPDGSLIVYGVADNGYRSSDGGKTWSQLNLPTSENLIAGTRLHSGAIVIASESGTLFSSKDNGVTFMVVENTPTRSIFDLQEASNGDLIVVGNSGVVRISQQLLDS